MYTRATLVVAVGVKVTPVASATPTEVAPSRITNGCVVMSAAERAKRYGVPTTRVKAAFRAPPLKMYPAYELVVTVMVTCARKIVTGPTTERGGLNEPTAHVIGALEPGGAYEPPGAGTHVVADVAPAALLKVPPLQGVQAIIPVRSAYVPAGQGKHDAPPCVDVPIGHWMHVAEPTAEVPPAGHAVHALTPTDARLEFWVLMGQNTQVGLKDGEHAEIRYEPAPQPGLQARQADASANTL